MSNQSKSQQDFIDIDKPILNFIQKGKETRTAKTILGKNKVGEITLRDSQNYYKAKVNKAVWSWKKAGLKDQWN